MRPHLIVDFRDRSLFALVATEEGETFLCTQENGGSPNRYFSAELLLDPAAGERSDRHWDEISDLLDGSTPSNLLARLRRLGLRRPWQLEPGDDAVRLDHPLQVLSTRQVLAGDDAGKSLPPVAAALTAALLEPVFHALALGGHEARELCAVAIVPACYSRPARLLLHKLFRRQGIRRLTILTRESAAAMALADEAAASGCLVCDVTESGLHLHRVVVEDGEDGRRVRTSGSRILRGFGWPFWVERVAAALQEKSWIADLSGRALRAVDRAWTGLAGGPYPCEISSDPPHPLTIGLLQELISRKLATDLSAVLEERMQPLLAGLGWTGGPAIALGQACSISALQDLIVSAAGASQPSLILQMPPLERCMRGVATALRWQAQGPRRHIAVEDGGGLRLDTLRGESIEILSAGGLPRYPKQRCRSRRVFRVEGDLELETSLVVQLLWGCCPEAEGNAWVCTLPLELAAADPETLQALEITLDLRCSRREPRWAGTANMALGQTAEVRRRLTLKPFQAIFKEAKPCV